MLALKLTQMSSQLALHHLNNDDLMHVSEEFRKPLLDFVSDLVNSGCSPFGPQCTFISEVSHEYGSLIPSKCIPEFFEAKYGTSSSYAPALADFLSSHKGFFGTVRYFKFCTITSSFDADG